MMLEAPKYDEDKNLCPMDWGHEEPFYLGLFEDELIAHIMNVRLTHDDYNKGYEINLDSTTHVTNSSHTRDDIMSTITITPRDKDCAVVTHRSKVTLQGEPSNPPPIVGTYNFEKLKKTPTQISLFELLHISPTHKAILDKALQDSIVDKNMDENTFQPMVGNLA